MKRGNELNIFLKIVWVIFSGLIGTVLVLFMLHIEPHQAPKGIVILSWMSISALAYLMGKVGEKRIKR